MKKSFFKKFKKGVDKQEILLYDWSVLERQHRKVHKNKNAEVAELADAQASGACGSNTVRVQVPPSALFIFCLKELAVCSASSFFLYIT